MTKTEEDKAIVEICVSFGRLEPAAKARLVGALVGIVLADAMSTALPAPASTVSTNDTGGGRGQSDPKRTTKGRN